MKQAEVTEMEEEEEEGGNTLATTSMSRRTSLDTVDFDANYGEMRHLQFSHDEEEEEDSRTEPRQQDILTGNHNLPKLFLKYLLYLTGDSTKGTRYCPARLDPHKSTTIG